MSEGSENYRLYLEELGRDLESRQRELENAKASDEIHKRIGEIRKVLMQFAPSNEVKVRTLKMLVSLLKAETVNSVERFFLETLDKGYDEQIAWIRRGCKKDDAQLEFEGFRERKEIPSKKEVLEKWQSMGKKEREEILSYFNRPEAVIVPYIDAPEVMEKVMDLAVDSRRSDDKNELGLPDIFVADEETDLMLQEAIKSNRRIGYAVEIIDTAPYPRELFSRIITGGNKGEFISVGDVEQMHEVAFGGSGIKPASFFAYLMAKIKNKKLRDEIYAEQIESGPKKEWEEKSDVERRAKKIADQSLFDEQGTVVFNASTWDKKLFLTGSWDNQNYLLLSQTESTDNEGPFILRPSYELLRSR